ncbi:MAG: acyl-CoA desaturase [Dehalococcoidia bacterium]|nr:acyl-CoA desaturase [Dehalococcoidia bacterium]
MPAPETLAEPITKSSKLEWLRCLPFIAIHIAAVTVFFTSFNQWCVILFLCSYTIRMFGITAFYHRYFSHRAFKTNRIVQLAGATLACSAGQRGPLWWAAHHRMHHRHSDTDKDIHSPKQKGFFWSHIFWFMTEYANPTYMKHVSDWKKYPELCFLNRFDWIPFIVLGALIYLTGEMGIFKQHLGSSGLQWLVWGFILPTIALYHATFSVNSIAHMFGSRRFATKDTSRNNIPVAILTLGEGWHNNHHFYPASVKQGFTKKEFDPTYHGLRILEKLGLIHSLNLLPTWVLRKIKP